MPCDRAATPWPVATRRSSCRSPGSSTSWPSRPTCSVDLIELLAFSQCGKIRDAGEASFGLTADERERMRALLRGLEPPTRRSRLWSLHAASRTGRCAMLSCFGSLPDEARDWRRPWRSNRGRGGAAAPCQAAARRQLSEPRRRAAPNTREGKRAPRDRHSVSQIAGAGCRAKSSAVSDRRSSQRLVSRVNGLPPIRLVARASARLRLTDST